MRRPRRVLLLGLAAVVACAGSDRPDRAAGTGRSEGRDSVLVVFNAGSLARPLRAALDSFARRERVRVEQENAGSLETARKLTELGKIPDLVALADYEIFPKLLVPEHVRWYVAFARNRMVLAYGSRTRGAEVLERNRDTWPDVLLRPGVETGFSDPALDPAGYRTLLVMRLAELHYRRPGLSERLVRAVPRRNVRPKSADLVALLQAGELDYAWEYESVARAAGLRYLRLPSEIDLSTPEHARSYERVSVRVPGRTPRDSIAVRGEPIVYALSVPASAPHRGLAERAAAFLLSPAGHAIMRGEMLDPLAQPLLYGSGAPGAVEALTEPGPAPRR